MIGPTCPRCGWIHAPVTVVGSRFRPGGITGYRSALGGPVRATRDEAARDWCDTKRQQRDERPTPRPQAAEQPHLFDLPRIVGQSEPKPPPEFPTALMETAARAKAWRDFLAQAHFSLIVWQIDTGMHDDIEHVLVWLRQCRDELNALVAAERVQC